MTQPTVIFLGPDGGDHPRHHNYLKVFLRTLLYSTSQRGQMLESIYVNLQRGESRQNFSIWVYGDGQLARGSGLFVPSAGIACNHHFLLPKDGTNFELLEGEYILRVFAKNVNDMSPSELFKTKLTISKTHAEELLSDNAGVYFDWGPDQQSYHPHIESRSKGIPSYLLKGAGT
ncbi:MAG: hypothetical protein V1806_03985 [Pseudomonadota bacterium]